MEKLDNKNYILMSIIIIEYILLFMSWVIIYELWILFLILFINK